MNAYIIIQARLHTYNCTYNTGSTIQHLHRELVVDFLGRPLLHARAFWGWSREHCFETESTIPLPMLLQSGRSVVFDCKNRERARQREGRERT